MATSRQLAAIMFADIAGYTSIMQDDEVLALRLRYKLQKKLEEEVGLHEGKLLELRGDGALCSFSSTSEAVRAAVALQLDMLTEPVVPLRIGIHTGDVVVEDNSIYGDGVNIASRMESFSVPGSIFVSARVYDDIKNQKDLQTVSMGKFALKNVREPLEIFAVSNQGIFIPNKSSLEGKGEKVQQKVVLVLPFINMSNDLDQDYFSDGLTEELIASLSRLKDIRVVSRTTSMLYKGTQKDIRTIGMETDASYVVEGSVRRQGNNVRITAQFVDAERDSHLWAENYRGTMDDIFDIQENVASKIVEGLRMQLTGSEKVQFRKRYTDDSEAYQLYLQGRYFWNKRNEAGLNSSIRYFKKALEKDPDYALAWSGLADAYSLLSEYTTISRKEMFPKTMEAVNKAMALDDQLAEPHISLGSVVMLNEWDWKRAEKEFKLGIQLNPLYATAHHWYGELLLFLGRSGEAFREMSQAVEQDPFSQGILKDMGMYYYYTRQYDKAIEFAKRTLEMDPHFIVAHRLLSLAYQGMGSYDKSISENKRWGEGMKSEKKANIALAQIYGAAGRKEEAVQLIEKIIASEELIGNDYRGVALVYASLGDREKAFEWLEKSYDHHDESLGSLKVDPKVDLLRTDPRYMVLLKKIRLEE